MDHATPFHNFSNACEHYLFSLTTKQPLAESEARIVAYYCKEIFAMVEPSLHTETGVTNIVTESHNHSSPSAT